MTDRPTQILFSAKTFSVAYDKGALDAHNGRDRFDSISRISRRDQEIVIDDTLAEELIRESLFHECLHGIWTDAGMDELEGLSEEQVVNCMTPRLVSLMRDNPELMEYMLRETDEENDDDS